MEVVFIPDLDYQFLALFLCQFNRFYVAYRGLCQTANLFLRANLTAGLAVYLFSPKFSHFLTSYSV